MLFIDILLKDIIMNTQHTTDIDIINARLELVKAETKLKEQEFKILLANQDYKVQLNDKLLVIFGLVALTILGLLSKVIDTYQSD